MSLKLHGEARKIIPSMSAVCPIVFFHCFSALTILRRHLSPSLASGPTSGSVNPDDFVIDSIGLEKYAWIL
jgi:hypothetical protein